MVEAQNEKVRVDVCCLDNDGNLSEAAIELSQEQIALLESPVTDEDGLSSRFQELKRNEESKAQKPKIDLTPLNADELPIL